MCLLLLNKTGNFQLATWPLSFPTLSPPHYQPPHLSQLAMSLPSNLSNLTALLSSHLSHLPSSLPSHPPTFPTFSARYPPTFLSSVPSQRLKDHSKVTFFHYVDRANMLSWLVRCSPRTPIFSRSNQHQ